QTAMLASPCVASTTFWRAILARSGPTSTAPTMAALELRCVATPDCGAGAEVSRQAAIVNATRRSEPTDRFMAGATRSRPTPRSPAKRPSSEDSQFWKSPSLCALRQRHLDVERACSLLDGFQQTLTFPNSISDAPACRGDRGLVPDLMVQLD